jgi:hypothetical protein
MGGSILWREREAANGWVRVQTEGVAPPRRISALMPIGQDISFFGLASGLPSRELWRLHFP